MATKIDQKIVAYKVINKDEKAKQDEQAVAAAEEKKQNNIIQMHEKVKRPEVLVGSTYKIKTPASEHAMYITIHDIVLNEGTDHEQHRPFEVFINSKNMDHFQWIVALTRITSAVFRKGGDVTFLVEEMQAVFDPKGGYFKKGGRFMPSLVAEIGEVIEQHLKKIGMIVDEEMHETQKQILTEKRAEYEKAQKTVVVAVESAEDSDEQYPAGASLCVKCSTKAVIMMDGCMTCLSCGDSKCG
jgi:hypothetical protein